MIDPDRPVPPPDQHAERRLEELLAEHRDEPEEPEPEATEFDPFAPLPTDPDLDEGSGAGEPGGEDEEADDLPDAPLFALLRSIEHDVGVDRIDHIWVFPPRRLEAGETSVVVVSAYPELDDGRRRVYAAHYTAREEARDFRLALDEYGTAPTERVGRLVEEVVDRIKDGPAGAPRPHAIEGSDERWSTVLHELAGRYLDEVQKNPRLRR